MNIFPHHGLHGVRYKRKKQELLKEQNGNCYWCSEALEGVICIDHDHTTGVIRGLVHKACNSKIKVFETKQRLLTVRKFFETLRDSTARCSRNEY